MDTSIVDTSMAVHQPQAGPSTSNPSPILFQGITYLLSTSLPPGRRAELDALLQQYGGQPVDTRGVRDPRLTTVISRSGSLRWEGWEVLQKLEEKADEGKAHEGNESTGKRKNKVDVVSDVWVERSLLLDELQLAHHFSVDPALIFSGVVACATDLPVPDLEVLSAGITALGGQWRTGLTRDVTHLFALHPGSSKYETAMHHREDTRVKVILPHWFDDAVRLGNGKLATEEYEWPEARILKGLEGVAKEKDGDEKDNTEQEKVKKNLYATAALFTPSMNQVSPPADADLSLGLALSSSGGVNKGTMPNGSSAAPVHANQVWGGRRILLSRTLQLYKGRRAAVAVSIERAGGIIVGFEGDDAEEEEEYEVTVALKPEDRGYRSPVNGVPATRKVKRLHPKERARRVREAEMVGQCDVLVTRWRYGRAYVRAVREAKTVGTLAWIFHVHLTGILASPTDQLLHYPPPKREIDGFSNHVVTVTNYTGEAREYLKKLITAMGATFTPSMSGQNTVLVAAFISGTKATKALAWSIPVVNHTWLEDCFVQWRNLTVALEKYIVFPPGVDFSAMLGERGVFVGGSTTATEDGGTAVLGRIEQEAEELAEDDDEIADELEGEVEAELIPPNGTEAQEMKEVQQGLVDDDDVVMYDEPPIPPTDDLWDFGAGDAEKEKKASQTKKAGTQQKNAGSSKKAVPVVMLSSSKSHAKSTNHSSATKSGSTSKPKSKVPADAEIIDLSDNTSEDEGVQTNTVTKKDPPTKAKKKKEKDSANEKAAKGKKVVSDHDEDEDEEEAPPRRVSKDAKTASAKRRAAVGSSDEEGEDAMDVDIASQKDDEVREEEENEDSDFARQSVKKGKKSKAPAAAPPAKAKAKSTSKPNGTTVKGSKSTPAHAIDDVDDDEIAVISAPKAKAKPSTTQPPPPPATLLSKAKGDARTRVKRTKKDKETKVIASESEEEMVVEKESTGKSKAKSTTKAAAKKKKGRAAASPSEDELGPESEEDEQEEEEEEEEEAQPTKSTRPGKTSNPQAKVASKPESKTTPSSAARKRAKPLRVDSTDEQEEPVGLDNHKQAKDGLDDSDDNDSEDSMPEHPQSMTKAEKRAAEATAKAKERENSSTKAATKAKPKAPAKSTGKRKNPSPVASETEEESHAEIISTKSKQKTAVKSTTKSTENPLQSSSAAKGISTPKRVVSVLMPSLNLSGRGGKSKADAESSVKAKTSARSKETAKAKNTAADETEESDDAEVEEGSIIVSKSRGKVAAKTSAKAPAKAAPKPRSKSKHTPLPSDEDEDEEKEEEEVSILVSPRSGGVPRTQSLRVMSAHLSTSAMQSPSTAKGSKSAKAKSTASKGKDKALAQDVAGPSSKRTRVPAAMDIDTSVSDAEEEIIPPPALSSLASTYGPPRRTAAAKASQRLQDIMPDMNTYEIQKRRAAEHARRGSRVMDAFKVDGEGDLDDLVVGGRARKRGGRHDGDAEDDDGADTDKRSKKRRRVSAEGNDDEIIDMDTKKTLSAKAKGKQKAVSMDVDEDGNVVRPAEIMLMTTQVALADDTIKTLTKLGVKITTRPAECTHLLARQLVRTEKFLCALTRAPWILSEKWALSSAEAKKLLPEKGFLLKDKAGESKYGVNLADSLRKAETNQGKLLLGHTFYITPRVQVDTKLLKNVVNACGGHVTTQTPTPRVVNAAPEVRHVISCKEDVSIWRSLAAADIQIYTQELLLNGVLKQEMEWDNKEFYVKTR